MNRTIFCRKYQQTLPGLAMPPLPGEKGKAIFEQVSQKAWDEWQQLQTQLINEKHLSLLNPDNRRYLMAQMDAFMDNQPTDIAEGYVPPSA